MDDMLVTEYDGCGMCLLGVRRLSRWTDATSSPERQGDQIIDVTTRLGGHIIGWADDWEVSGATNPMERPQLGPWLRGEMGPYSGIVGSTVDRVGRNMRDTLNTGWMIKDAGRLLITANHGVWNLDDPAEENQFTAEAWGAQMELRAIQKRNRDDTKRARDAGQPKQKPSYGYRYVRLAPTAKVDHVEIDTVAAEVIRNVAERILSGDDEITCSTEAARLTRAGIPSPSDHRALMYGRKPKGGPWTPRTVKTILTSEAALGYLMHQERPVLDEKGRPRRLADPLWDRTTHEALVKATAPKRKGPRAPKGPRLLSGRAFCGTCGARLYVAGRSRELAYGCTARVRGIPSSAHCKPAPTMAFSLLEQAATDWFLEKYGDLPLFNRVYDPGTGHAARIAELTADRKRLRDDRRAGLYNSPDDAEWYRTEYNAMGAEIDELKKLPDRPAGMYWVRTGQTVADQWHGAADAAARREILASYQVRVVLRPTGHPLGRVWVHGLDAQTESDARQAAWEDYQEKNRNYQAWQDWRQVHGPEADFDAEEYARSLADDPEAHDQAADTTDAPGETLDAD